MNITRNPTDNMMLTIIIHFYDIFLLCTSCSLLEVILVQKQNNERQVHAYTTQ